ncbi:extracellular solute-binding protein [Paenibacillus methanolicus]|uniref:Putative aldouronate transport system substrate-binding protein n=1 Tax=Paenibacillus methanolicus TaxID=582686 RepID=A0A5S5CI40_9BACL|nr:extracellular solute-binding protein [Paenibacillus methanolicus]TYP79392.1 putative aldouronate transport system substrate-binding protein [Paenibacillus methanolicus]
MQMRWNHGKRICTTLAIVLGAVTALAACSGGGNGNSTETSSSEPTTKEKVTLKVLVPNNVAEFPSGKDVNNNEIANGIREKTGFNVQWELMPKDAEAKNQRLNVTMASGDTPDLIILQNPDKPLFGNFAQQGLLTPLDSLLDDSGPNIKKLMTPEQWKSAKWEGTTYAIRTFNYSSATYGLLARKDILAELGLKEPKTQDDFYEVLKAIKAKKPDMVPYTANLAEGLTGLEAIASMFYPPVDFVQKDGKVVYTAALPEAKSFLEFASKLYGEGLIDKESVVNKTANIKEKLASGKAAMATIGWWEAQATETAAKEKFPGSQLAFIDPPTGSNGAFGMSKVSVVSKYFVIPKASKHAKEVVEFLNKATEQEIIDFISFGVEGTHYEKKDGKAVPTKEMDNIKYKVYYNMFDKVELGLQRMENAGLAPYYTPVANVAKHENVVDLVAPVPIVDQKNQELRDLRDQYFLKIITGALPLSAYDEFLDKWKKAGGEDVVKALDEAYNGKK